MKLALRRIPFVLMVAIGGSYVAASDRPADSFPLSRGH